MTRPMGTTRRDKWRSWLVRAVPVVLAVCAGPGCSLIVDKNASQCASDADCAGFNGTVCIDRACVYPDGIALPPECSTHTDCVASKGDFYICRAADRQCVSLVSPDCETVAGDYTNEGAIFIGSLLPTRGENQSFGKPAENAIGMALDEFTANANGLPPAPGSTRRRPLVLVGCNDAGDPIAAATHLTADLNVPAIIGAAFSGVTIKVATDVTIPAGTLLISPSATSVAITQLQDNGLVWRTAPADTLQADALAQLVPEVESDVRKSEGMAATDTIKLAIAHKGDAYGKGLAQTLEKKLRFNGKPALDNGSNYLRTDYGDPAVGTQRYETVVAEVLAMKPHILLLFGTNEAVIDVFGPIESGWRTTGPAVAYQARHLFSDGGLLQELADLVGTNNELRLRVLGTVPGTNNDLFKAFEAQYSGTIFDGTTPGAFGVAGAYDATYLIAYSIVASGVQAPTGQTIAQGLSHLVPPADPIDVGGTEINNALTQLLQGRPLDFNGASGPLDFDLATGEAPSDIQVWCLPSDNGKAGAGTPSGRYFNATTGVLEGEIASVCL